MKILQSHLISSSTIANKIGGPVIVIHLLRLNQNRISDVKITILVKISVPIMLHK